MPDSPISGKNTWFVLLILTVFVLLLRLPSLELPLSNDGGAQAYHARLIVRGEPLYGSHHTGHHLPAVYYVYALALSLFGDRAWSIKLMTSVWVLGTVYAIYLLMPTLLNRKVGILAAILYAILSSNLFLMGPSEEIELFANLPRTLAVLLALRFSQTLTDRHQPGDGWKFGLVGSLSAIALMFKVVYLSPILITGCVVAVQYWQHRTDPAAWRLIIARSLWFGVGFGLVMIGVVGYFTSIGLLSRLALVLTIGSGYVNFRNTAARSLLSWFFPLLALLRANMIVFILSLIALVTALVGRSKKTLALVYILLWYGLAMGESLVTRILFPHYYLLILPPVAILVAWLLVKIYTDLTHVTHQKLMASVISYLVVLLLCSYSLWLDRDFYGRYLQYKLGQGSFDDFVLSGAPTTGPEQLTAEKMAAYLRQRTAPEDFIYYWSSSVELYYLADRYSPIDTIWPDYATATGPYQRIFSPQTTYVIIGESSNIPRPDWLHQEVAKAYELETVIDGQELYRRSE